MPHSPLPWAIRARITDEWGLIRDGLGLPVANTMFECHVPFGWRGMPWGKRKDTVPPIIEANAALIVAAVNSHAELLAAAWAFLALRGSGRAPTAEEWAALEAAVSCD